MKLRISTLLILSLAMVNSFAEDVTCQNHPAMLKAKDLFERTSIAFNSSKKGKRLLKEFMSSTPEIKTKDELGVCNEFAGQQSCCSSDFVHFLDRLATVSEQNIYKATSMFSRFAKLVIAAIENSNCLNKNSWFEGNDYVKIFSRFSYDKGYEKDQRKIMVDYAQQNMRYTRGGLCSMCMGVDKVADYFENDGNLVISQASNKMFVELMYIQFSAVTNLISKINFNRIIYEMFNNYSLSNCTIKSFSKYESRILDIVKANRKILEKSSGNRQCDGSTLFGDRSPCNNLVFGDQYFDSETKKYSEGMNIRRLFDDTPDVVVSSTTKGVNAYLSSDEDTRNQDNYLAYYAELDGDEYFIETSREYSEYWNQAPSRPSPFLLENIIELAVCLLLVVIIYWKRKD